MNTEAKTPPAGGTLVALWMVVLIELISPIPAFLTLGAAWVLLTRPAWFLALVRELYGLTPDGK